MQQRPDDIALLRAILLENCISDGAAGQHLVETRRLGVDPLDYCAHRFGLGYANVYGRAAHWAGFAFHKSVPRDVTPFDAGGFPDLDQLNGVRTMRVNVLGRDVVFATPPFAGILQLHANRQGRPELVRTLCITPPDAMEAALCARHSRTLLVEARQRLTRLWAGMTAGTGLNKLTRLGFTLALCGLIVLAMAAGTINRPILVPICAALLLGPALLRLVAAIPLPPKPPVRLLADWELPIYSVLIPLRDEARMIPMLRRAMSALDYPPEKLDIKFVVESVSTETILAVRDVLDDPRFRLVVVPHGPPHTKPKAANYALPLARGDHVVVYDAEDVPDPGQLRLAASTFANDSSVACLQAELVPENAEENLLTALFAGEYAGLFGRLLPALAQWGFAVPLGGTSNHFRTAALRRIGGWDAANVTEDADLGVRLRRRGMRVEALASRTYEEAPTSLHAWMAQRTRWMKGWMVTYLVHSVAPRAFLRDVGWKAFLGFHVLVGGMILTALLHTVFIGSLLGLMMFEGSAGFRPDDIWDWISIVVLVVGYSGAAMLVLSGIAHLRAWQILPVLVLLPAYWLLHSIAALYAARELVTKPQYWAKTTHGQTRKARNGALPKSMPLTEPARSRTG
ncbi:MAG: glycosyltransferase [Devosia sp.]